MWNLSCFFPKQDHFYMLKFIYSEKATTFSKISTNYLTGSTYRTNNWWRFFKILWPSQNIWTLHTFVEKTKFARVWFSSKVVIRIESVLCCIFELLAEFFFATTSNSIQNTNLTDCQYTYSVADIAEYIQFIRRVIT